MSFNDYNRYLITRKHHRDSPDAKLRIVEVKNLTGAPCQVDTGTEILYMIDLSLPQYLPELQVIISRFSANLGLRYE